MPCDSSSVELCRAIAERQRRGQVDKDGHPYILHSETVAAMASTPEESCTGLLHDVVEYTGESLDELREKEFPRQSSRRSAR